MLCFCRYIDVLIHKFAKISADKVELPQKCPIYIRSDLYKNVENNVKDEYS